MRKLSAVFILVFFAVIAAGTLALVTWEYPWMLLFYALCVTPFLIIWAITELEK